MKPTEIKDLHPDEMNFNRGTYEGELLMEHSLSRLKAGRSILIDQNNNIIAGNKTADIADRLGYKLRTIETDGTTLIAVKRTDISLDSKEGRELAIADNATAQMNLSWDENAMAMAEEQFGFDASDWGIDPMKNQPTFESLGEVDIDDFDTDQELKLTYSSQVYEKVVKQLKEYDENLSCALLKILGYYGNV